MVLCGAELHIQVVLQACAGPQHKLSWVMATEEPAGGSHLVLSITPPAWPCPYLTVEQQFLMWTCGCLMVEVTNTIFFLSKKILQEDSKPKCQWTFLGVGSVQCALSRGLSDTAQLGVPSTWRDVRLSVFFLFLVLALKNDFLSNSLWSLSAFLTGTIRYTSPSALHYRVSAE